MADLGIGPGCRPPPHASVGSEVETLSLNFSNDHTQYRLCRLFLPISITTDHSNNWPDCVLKRWMSMERQHNEPDRKSS